MVEDEDEIVIIDDGGGRLCAVVVNGDLRFEVGLPFGIESWTKEEVRAHMLRFVAPVLKTRMSKARRERDSGEEVRQIAYYCPFCGLHLDGTVVDLTHPKAECSFSEHVHPVSEWRRIARSLDKELKALGDGTLMTDRDKEKLNAAEAKRARKAANLETDN